MTKPLTLQYANMCPIMINDHPSVACQFGKLFRFHHTHGLAEGCRSFLKLLSLWQIHTKISFPTNDITQFIIVWGCAWILIEKSLNGPAYENTCCCSESIMCWPVIILLKKVCVWNNQLWLNDYGARIKAFYKNKVFNRKGGAPGQRKKRVLHERGRREPHLFFPLICCPFVSI